MAIDRIRVVMTAFPGQPGYMNFYSFGGPGSAVTAITAFLNALKTHFPASINFAIPNTGDSVSESSGHLVGGWTGGAATNVVANGPGSNVAAAGACVLLKTGTVVDGRRPIGRILLVPLIVNDYHTDGGITSGAQTAINTAAATLISPANNIVVWHRPKYDYTTDPPTLVRPGSYVTPTSAICNQKATVLTSRRD